MFTFCSLKFAQEMQELRLGGKIASVDVVIDAPLCLFQEYTKDEEEEEKKE